MDFNDLLAKLEKIDKKQTLMEQTLMEQLTLQQVQAAEKQAADAAAQEKKTGMLGGIFKTDPQTAGNVALAKLAAQHKLPGLFNSKGEFVVADDKRGDKNSYTGQATTPVQIAPPTPQDYEPLAALGLVPGNAKGPSGLANVLSGGKAQQGFDSAKTASTKVGADQTNAKFKADKLKQLNDLVAKLNAEVQGGNTDPGVGKVDYKIAESLLKEFGLSEKADPSKPASMKTVNGMNIYTNDPPTSGGVGAFGANPNIGNGDLVSQINAIMRELGDMGDDPEVVAALNAAQKVLDAKKAKDATKATAQSSDPTKPADATAAKPADATAAKPADATAAKPADATAAKPADATAAKPAVAGEKGSKPTTPQSTAQEKMDRFVFLMNKKKASAGTATTVTNPAQADQSMSDAERQELQQKIFNIGMDRAIQQGTGVRTLPESLANLMSVIKMLEESVLSEALDPAEEKELQAISQEVINTVNSGAEGIPPEVLAAVKEFQASASPTQANKPADATKTASGYKGSAGAQEIQKLNPEIKDVNKIRVGQVLKMPNGQPDYTVKAGDTLDKIARGVKPAGQLDQIAAAKPANATSSAKPADATSSAKPADATSSAKPAPYVSSNKLANDWAYSVLQGKSEIAKVPPALKAEVDKVMANPPANWKKSDAATPAADNTASAKPPAADNTASAKPPAASSGQVRIERLDMIKARSTQEYQAIVKAKGYKQGPDGKLSSSDERKADLFYKAEIQNGKIKNYPQLQPVAEELDRILSIAGLR